MTDKFQVPMSSPDLTEEDRQAVLDVLRTPNLSMGPKILAFEKAFQDLTGAKHAIGVNSGTAGLHLCVRAAGIGPGDLVLTTPFSFVASSNVLLYEQAIPIFVDVDPRTGNMDAGLLAEAAHDLAAGGKKAGQWLPRQNYGNRLSVKALLPVDVFGQPAEWRSIREVASRYGLKVIEDACEALGARYLSRLAGTFGDFGVFAFYPNKQITTGEGGMVITNDDRAADLMRALRNQGRSVGDTWLQHTYLGYNYRLDEMSAALGLAQMARLDVLISQRGQVAGWYGSRLSQIPGVETYPVETTTSRMSWFVYVVRFDARINRDALISRLERRGIPARPYFAAIHLHPYMSQRFGYRRGDFPATEDLALRSLALPFSSVMTEAQVELVCQVLREEIG
jgi:dTDP-4-amino-4,6-dideoxygalactose transaminase